MKILWQSNCISMKGAEVWPQFFFNFMGGYGLSTTGGTLEKGRFSIYPWCIQSKLFLVKHGYKKWGTGLKSSDPDNWLFTLYFQHISSLKASSVIENDWIICIPENPSTILNILILCILKQSCFHFYKIRD